MLLKHAALNDEESSYDEREYLKSPTDQRVHAMWRKTKGETMEARRCPKVTDDRGCCFMAKRAASVSVGVLLMTVLAGAGEPVGKDADNIAIASARQADSRDGSAHKAAAEVLLGRRHDNSFAWNHVRTVTGLSGHTGTKVARQNAEAIILHCQRALALGVKDEEAYWMMGEGYFLQKQYREAIDAGLGALQIRPDFYPALHLLIRSHSREGEYETALDYCLIALATRPRGISTPHLFYFYSLCRRLVAAGRYATVLSYYEKWAELSSKIDIRWPEYDLAKEKSHVKYYLNSPIKGYPPTVTFARTPRFGRSEELSAEEKQRLMALLNQIAVSCSSPNITVTAVSVEKKGILSQAQISRTWWGAIHGEVGAFEVEFKGELKKRLDRAGLLDSDPSDLQDEINRTKAEAIKGFLQQAATHLGIPPYVLGDLYLSWDGYRLTYLPEPTYNPRSGFGDLYVSHDGYWLRYLRELRYKGVPLRIHDWGGPGFAVDWGSGDLRKRNVFSIHSTLYTLPTADIPLEPLVAEKQARAIATEALTNRYRGVRQETSVRPDDSLAGREIEIGQVSLCIQPEPLSFGYNIDTDLFDPVYGFVEYRLLWLAIGKEISCLVKVDAITGEILAIKALGMN
jgi:tetratricopeptide (TPR) repeat protein